MKRKCAGKVIFATDPNETKCVNNDDFDGKPCYAYVRDGINHEYDVIQCDDDYENYKHRCYLVDLKISMWWIMEEHLIFTEPPIFEEEI